MNVYQYLGVTCAPSSKEDYAAIIAACDRFVPPTLPEAPAGYNAAMPYGGSAPGARDHWKLLAQANELADGVAAARKEAVKGLSRFADDVVFNAVDAYGNLEDQP